MVTPKKNGGIQEKEKSICEQTKQQLREELIFAAILWNYQIKLVKILCLIKFKDLY